MSESQAQRNYVEDTEVWLGEGELAAVRAALGAIADEVVAAIQREVPDYARPLEGGFGASIRLGTEVALRRLIGDEQDASSDRVYRRLGAGEYRAGRGLDALQSAYRVGARVAWRRISDVAAAAGASPGAQRSLAEAVFAYIDRIAGESVEGYAEAQLSDAGDLDRRRGELAELLLAGAPVDDELVRVAEAARWPLPRTLACLAVAGDGAERARHRISGDSLPARRGEAVLVIVANPVGLEREARAIAEQPGTVVGLGPTVAALAELPASARLARRALALASPDAPVILAEERLADIALGAAPEILAALRARLLAPLEAETPASRARLEATLFQWLRHRGSQSAVARELQIHPQTVRYRMGRLRELLGDALAEPEQRFALELALRGRPFGTPWVR